MRRRTSLISIMPCLPGAIPGIASLSTKSSAIRDSIVAISFAFSALINVSNTALFCSDKISSYLIRVEVYIRRELRSCLTGGRAYAGGNHPCIIWVYIQLEDLLYVGNRVSGIEPQT